MLTISREHLHFAIVKDPRFLLGTIPNLIWIMEENLSLLVLWRQTLVREERRRFIRTRFRRGFGIILDWFY